MSQSLSVSLSEVLSALSALYHHPNPSTKQHANHYLIRVVQHPSIWSIADQILHDHSLSIECHYFAATTLRSKLVYSFNELPDQHSKQTFKQSLLHHITVYHQTDSQGKSLIQNNNKAIRTSLVLCLATLSIQLIIRDEWDNALNELMTLLSHTTTNQLPPTLLLSFLSELAEEASNSRLDFSLEQRNSLLQALSASSERLLQLLGDSVVKCATVPQQQADEQRALIFSCLMSWVRNQLTEPNALLVSKPNEQPQLSALLRAVFECLSNDELVSVCSDLLIELIGQSRNIAAYAAFQHVITIHSLQLKPLYDSRLASSENEEHEQHEESLMICRKLMHLWTAICEDYSDLILSLSDLSAAALNLALHCMQHNNSSIVDGCFNGFYVLAEVVTSVPNAHPDKVKLHSWLAPFYCRMIDCTLAHIATINKTTVTHKVDSSDSERVEECKRFRYHAADAFQDCGAVLGIDNMLHYVYEQRLLPAAQTYSQSQGNEWQSLEACLYCFRSIGRNVNIQESRIITQVMQCVFGLGNTQNMALRYTATLLIGRYADWIAVHADLLSTSFQLVCQSLYHSEIASCAALGFKHVCEGCRMQLAADAKHIETILLVYREIVCTSRLLQSDEREVIQGCVSVIVTLPGAKLFEMVHTLTAPIVKDLQQALTAHSNTTVDLYQTLDRLSEILHHLDPNANEDFHLVCSCIVELTKSVAELLSRVQMMHMKDSRMIEKLCRCWKYSIKGSREQFKPLLQQLLTMLTHSFVTEPQSTFLYLIATTTDVFHADPFFNQLIAQSVYEAIMRKAVQTLEAKTESIVQHSDLCEDLYELLNRLVQRCPQLIFQQRWTVNSVTAQYLHTDVRNLILFSLFHISIYGVCQSHRESLSSICAFQHSLLNQVIDFPRHNARRGGKPKLEHVAVVREMLKLEMEVWIGEMVKAITGGLQGSRIQQLSPTIDSLLLFEPQATLAAFQHHLQQIDLTNCLPVGMSQHKAKHDFMSGLKEWTELEIQHRKGLKTIVEQLNKLCTKSEDTD